MPTKQQPKKTLYSALSDFQNDCPNITKGKQGYGYKYADLPSILNTITPILRKHGLVLAQPIIGRTVETILTHIPTGEELRSAFDIPDGQILKGMNQFQTDGSGVSYYRRYSIAALLCIVTDEDNDAAGEPVNKGRTVKEGTALFQNCVKGYLDGRSKEEMEAKGLSISAEVWNQITGAK